MADRFFPGELTWWPRTSDDGYGGFIFGTPVLVPCRWEDKQMLFRSRTGEEEMSQAVAYVDRSLEIGDYLMKGDQRHLSNPTLLEEAYEIKQFSEIPDIRYIKTERKAIM